MLAVGFVIAAAAASVAIGVAAVGGDDQEVPVSSSDPATGNPSVLQGVRGTIRRQDGTPVAGALVTPTSLDMPSKAVPEIAVTSQADGRYEWTLDPGKYEITVSADGYRPQTKAVTVAADAAATLDFDLEATG